MQKAAKKTDTKTDTKAVRGIRFVSDPTRHKAPWMLTTFPDGKKKRTFWPTKAAAIEEQAEHRRTAKKYGTDSHAYDRAAHAEYEEAKKRLPAGRSLSEAVDFYTQRNALGTPEAVPTVTDAATHLVELKRSLKRSRKTIEDMEFRFKGFRAKFGDRLISTIGRNETLDWILSLPGGARSKRNTFSALNNLFSYASRRGWVICNPCGGIDPNSDLPTPTKSRIGILMVEQGHAILRSIEAHYPRYIHWALLKYFAGVRFEESNRFQGEWIDAKQRRICIPGWFIDDAGEKQPGSKTRDDWVIDRIDPHFWTWLKRYPVPTGPLPFARERTWMFMKRRFAKVEGPGQLKTWPHNGWRHSFATYDLSAHRDQTRTSLILRHQSPRKLWSNYLAHLIPSKQAKRYFAILPSL